MRHPIRENIRVGVPITLEPGPDRISPPRRSSTVYHGPGFAKTPLRRQVQAPTGILAALVGIHRQSIARCYPRGCPAATLDCMHNSVMAAGFVLFILAPVAYVSVVWARTV